jgi:hypothetical protein
MISFDIGLVILFAEPLLSGYSKLAYLDPGTGSFLVQLLIGGLVGILVILKAYWAKIRAFFSKGNQNQTEVLPEVDQSTPDLSDDK